MRCSKVVLLLQQTIHERDERIAELEDRLMANSLAELRAVRPVAMPAVDDAPADGYWSADPTGLVRQWVPYVPDPDAE